MSRDKVYNFSAGPSVMPLPVLEKAQSELLDHRGSGLSVMEMSHRSKQFMEIFDSTREKLRSVMEIPDTHEILFLQGGASLQFASVPMNLMKNGKASYAVTGHFSGLAAKEARKYGSVSLACDTSDGGHTRIPTQPELVIDPSADYFYYCANNTIYGTEWSYTPVSPVPIVCDMSSDILSRRVKVSDYGLIFAGAQKNMAPAGLTVVIIDKSLAGNALPFTPTVMDYQTMIDKDSMYNTPPCWCIYMLGNTLDWVREMGGISAMEQRKTERASLLYDYLELSKIFHATAEKGSRSDMNVCFRTGNDALDAEFVKGAAERGLLKLKGHRVTGGMRASLYNAMPLEGVKTLIEYMKEFEVRHNV